MLSVCMTTKPSTIFKKQSKNEARNRKFFCQLKHELKSRFNSIDTLIEGGRFIRMEYTVYREKEKRHIEFHNDFYSACVGDKIRLQHTMRSLSLI